MRLDEIGFGCLKSDLEDYLTTAIYINGTNLKEVIEELEKEQVAKKGLHIRNGCYEGVSFFIAFHNQNHFLGRTLPDYVYHDQQYTLYDYKYSGIPGDHSLTCKISIDAQEVVWHDFKNISRIIPFELDYGGLTFRFCREQYGEAIHLAKNNTEENMFT
ncbi:MAG: hypothetical protein AAGE93_02445 [Bacteroidota bacterium]